MMRGERCGFEIGGRWKVEGVLDRLWTDCGQMIASDLIAAGV